jgi:hypothetical protein
MAKKKPIISLVSHHISRNIFAMRCPVPECDETFPLSRRGDTGTYNIAQYHLHLRQTHNIYLPKPLEVSDGKE